MINDRNTYEIMKPEDVGSPGSQLVLGKHSGKHALQKRAELLGARLEGNVLPEVFFAFKRLADECGEVTDNQLLALIHEYTTTVSA
jgi:2-isopropylmalate synthase